ncbi:NAD kinase [Orrella sp. 11846]|uniref:NAD kinase n=1 Tax=Orrella sp. 11846 TaxID=3409913 RepID=UPI003B590215
MEIRTVALIGRYQDSKLAAHLHALAQQIEAAGRTILIERETAKNTDLTAYPVASYEEIGLRADLAIVLGGDGTMLAAARNLAPSGVPVAGINHGRLGFITDIPLQHTSTAIHNLLSGQYEIESRLLLEGKIIRDGQCLYQATALNDVVLNRAGRGGMIEVQADVDNHFMFTVRADGLIVSSPTGSTAYALSAMGPILHPSIRALLLVPVAPQTLSNRPIVLPDTSQVTLTVLAMSRTDTGASVHFDMQTWSDLQLGDQIQVQRAESEVKFIHPHGYSFFTTLRKKLDWNRLPATGNEEE